MKKKIGLLGGSFDPIHFGHIHLALALSEANGLDEVWFIPAQLSPFKEKQPLIDFNTRSKLVELAIEPIPFFKINRLESKRPPPSYTIDTVKALRITHPENQFYLLIGDDHIKNLKNWKDIERVLTIASPLFGTRGGEDLDLLVSLIPLIRNKITRIPVLEISSTFIRNRLEKNLYCGHLVPAPVLDYIKQNGLYSMPYG